MGKGGKKKKLTERRRRRRRHVNAKTATREMFVLAYSGRAACVRNSGRKKERENEEREESKGDKNREKQYAYASLRAARHTEATGTVKLTRMLSSPSRLLPPSLSHHLPRPLPNLLPSLSRSRLPSLSFFRSSSLYTCICIAVVCFHTRRPCMPVTIAFLE